MTKEYYDMLGTIDIDEKGFWVAYCGCSGYIEENYDAIITDRCGLHKNIKKIGWQQRMPIQEKP